MIFSDCRKAYHQSPGPQGRGATTSLPDRVRRGRRCKECDETSGDREGDREESSFRGWFRFLIGISSTES